MFSELEERFSNQIVTDLEMEEIEETKNVTVESNGNSGQFSNATWYTVYELDENEQRINEFDCYMK